MTIYFITSVKSTKNVIQTTNRECENVEGGKIIIISLKVIILKNCLYDPKLSHKLMLVTLLNNLIVCF